MDRLVDRSILDEPLTAQLDLICSSSALNLQRLSKWALATVFLPRLLPPSWRGQAEAMEYPRASGGEKEPIIDRCDVGLQDKAAPHLRSNCRFRTAEGCHLTWSV